MRRIENRRMVKTISFKTPPREPLCDALSKIIVDPSRIRRAPAQKLRERCFADQPLRGPTVAYTDPEELPVLDQPDNGAGVRATEGSAYIGKADEPLRRLDGLHFSISSALPEPRWRLIATLRSPFRWG